MDNTSTSNTTKKALPLRITRTVDEVAAILGVSRSAAYKSIKNGEIPSFTVAGRILVSDEAFQRFLQQRIYGHNL